MKVVAIEVELANGEHVTVESEGKAETLCGELGPEAANSRDFVSAMAFIKHVIDQTRPEAS